MAISYEYINGDKLKEIIVNEKKAKLGIGGPTFDSVRLNVWGRTNDLLKDEKTKERVIKALGGGKYRFQLWHGTSYAWGGVFSATNDEKAKKDIEALLQDIKDNKLDAITKKGVEETLAKRVATLKKQKDTEAAKASAINKEEAVKKAQKA
jgi:hypothetical protein